MDNLVSTLKEEIEKAYESFGLNSADITLINDIKRLSDDKILRGTHFSVHKES